MDSPYQVKLDGDRGRKQAELYHRAQKMAETYQKIAAVPAGFDFRKERVVGFTGERGHDTLWQALLQLVACHDEKEVRIGLLLSKRKKAGQRACCGNPMAPAYLDGKRKTAVSGR